MIESMTKPPLEMMTEELKSTGQATSPIHAANVAIDIAVQTGIASKYWTELIAYPPGSARSLWLQVDGSWKRFDNPPASMSELVQEAFLGTGSNVRVWFNGAIIVGLVVEGN